MECLSNSINNKKCNTLLSFFTLQSLDKIASSSFCFSVRVCSSCFFFMAFVTLSCCSFALVKDSERLNSTNCWFKLSIVVSLTWSLLTTWKYWKNYESRGNRKCGNLLVRTMNSGMTQGQRSEVRGQSSSSGQGHGDVFLAATFKSSKEIWLKKGVT